MNEWRPSLWFSGPQLEKVWDRARGMAEEDKKKKNQTDKYLFGGVEGSYWTLELLYLSLIYMTSL